MGNSGVHGSSGLGSVTSRSGPTVSLVVFVVLGLLCGPGCGDGNPPRGSISAGTKRVKQGAPEDSKIAAARSKARGTGIGGKVGKR